MKKMFFLAIAMIAFAGSTFASNDLNKVNNKEDEKVIKNEDLFKTCTIKVKGTIGEKKIDVEMRYKADDCAKGAVTIIKEIAKEV